MEFLHAARVKMYKRFVSNSVPENNTFTLIDDEHNHLANVLRLKTGDTIIVTCGDEFDYVCVILEITKKYTSCSIIEKVKNIHNPQKQIDVFHALIKNDKMSIVTQKLSELGVSTLYLFESKFQTVKASENKKEKLQKISNQSSKQCKRSLPMIVEDILPFNKMLDIIKNYEIVLFANETESAKQLNTLSVELMTKNKIAIIIGSEGGFERTEIDKIIDRGAISLSLGSRILRAETASIALSGFVSFITNN